MAIVVKTEQTYYAHSAGPDGKPELLSDHLAKVSHLASEFAAAFGASEWGAVVGRWHDLGKYSKEFQEYLKATADPDASEEFTKPARVDHSTFGARYAVQHIGGHRGQLLAFCIAGHHVGLPDAVPTDAQHERATLAYRLNEAVYCIPHVDLPAEA